MLLEAVDDVGMMVVDSRFREDDARLRRFFADLTKDGSPYSRLDRIIEGSLPRAQRPLDRIAVRRPGLRDHCRRRARQRPGARLPQDTTAAIRDSPRDGELDGVGLKRFPEKVGRPHRRVRLF